MGRVIFDIPIQRARETLKLRTVNNIWVLVGHTYKELYTLIIVQLPRIVKHFNKKNPAQFSKKYLELTIIQGL